MTEISEIPASRKNATRRLKIINGQVQGLVKLLESEPDCEKIFPQIKAIKNAFGSFSAEVMKEMLQECIFSASHQSEKKCTDETAHVKKIQEMIEKFSLL